MPRVATEITAFNFTAGFITEASSLVFPENASLDEENFELLRDGSRRRRLGMDYEAGFQLNTGIPATAVENRAVNTFVWRTVAQDGNLTFLVIQIGDTLYYHDLSGLNPNSQEVKGFTTNLNNHKTVNATIVGNSRVDFTSGLGRLICVSPEIEPITIEYDASTDTITETQINIQIRDFDGVDDGLDVEERATTITNTHKYNLRNQGWPESSRNFDNEAGSSSTVGDPIEKTKEEVGFYPSNSDIFYFGKSTAADQTATIGAYSPYELQKLEIRIGPAPKGRFIVNAFSTNRSEVSGIGGIPERVISERPSSVTFFFGRVFYALEDKVYFSQVISDTSDLGKCHQDNDPTAEDINALLDTDGGVVSFPNAGRITAIRSTKDAVFVMSNNGIWQIRGVEGKFVATEFNVKRLTGVSVDSFSNTLEVEGNMMVLSDSGIYLLSEDKVAGGFEAQNLTERTIQSFYLNIGREAINNSTLVYDSTERKVYMFYNGDPTFNGVTFKQKHDNVLIFDLVLGAFYKYSISGTGSGTPFVFGAYISDSPRQVEGTFEVTNSTLDNIITSGSDNVVEDIINDVLGSSELQMLAIVDNGAVYDYTFSEYNNTNFKDWTIATGGVDYDCFLETGYMVEEGARYKQGTYLITHFNRTERNFVDNGSGGVTFDSPSGCLGRAKWDWTSTSTASRWSSEQQLYRLTKPFLVGSIGDPFDYSYEVVTTKSKIRGKGRSLHLRFEAEPGKDCQLLGWSVAITGNASP